MKRSKEFPHATHYTDRHGKRRWRFRMQGSPSFELGTDYGSPDFVRRYEAALAHRKAPIGRDQVKAGSVSDLLAYYYQVALPRWSESTRKAHRAILERFRAAHGHRPVATMQPHHMELILAKMAATPAAAFNLRKRLIPVFRLAMKMGWLSTNPAELAESVPYHTKGHHTWSEDEIARFLEVHPFGTIPHRVMTLMLWTGAARADAVKLGWFSVKGDTIQYTRQKTGRMKNPVLIIIPIARELRALLDTLPRDAGTFLQTAEGKQRSEKALTGDMRKWCDAADLPDCTSHGLRKAIARRLGEAGASTLTIASITGHKTLSEVQRYTEAADRAKLATGGIALISGTKKGQNVANLKPRFAKKTVKVLK